MNETHREDPHAPLSYYGARRIVWLVFFVFIIWLILRALQPVILLSAFCARSRLRAHNLCKIRVHSESMNAGRLHWHGSIAQRFEDNRFLLLRANASTLDTFSAF